MVHGAAVVGPRGAALLAGPSGAGKSTTALAAAEYGLGFVADDYCAVGRADRALPLLGRQARSALARAAVLPGGPTPDGKEIVVPSGLTRDRRRWSRSCCRASAARSGLEPARPAEALSALATSLLLLPGSRQDDLAALGALARSLPAHRLATGPDPHAAAAALAEHLA